MAYCRWGEDSDVYMYSSILGGYDFFLSIDKYFNVPTAKEALHRLKRLKTQGYKIPDYAIERLQEDIEKGETNDKIEDKNDRKGKPKNKERNSSQKQ